MPNHPRSPWWGDATNRPSCRRASRSVGSARKCSDRPAPSHRGRAGDPAPFEDREASSTNPEERPSLELGLVRARKGMTDPSDQLQRVQVLGVERHPCDGVTQLAAASLNAGYATAARPPISRRLHGSAEGPRAAPPRAPSRRTSCPCRTSGTPGARAYPSTRSTRRQGGAVTAPTSHTICRWPGPTAVRRADLSDGRALVGRVVARCAADISDDGDAVGLLGAAPSAGHRLRIGRARVGPHPQESERSGPHAAVKSSDQAPWAWTMNTRTSCGTIVSPLYRSVVFTMRSGKPPSRGTARIPK
jgi:hypothetical protein